MSRKRCANQNVEQNEISEVSHEHSKLIKKSKDEIHYGLSKIHHGKRKSEQNDDDFDTLHRQLKKLQIEVVEVVEEESHHTEQFPQSHIEIEQSHQHTEESPPTVLSFDPFNLSFQLDKKYYSQREVIAMFEKMKEAVGLEFEKQLNEQFETFGDIFETYISQNSPTRQPNYIS